MRRSRSLSNIPMPYKRDSSKPTSKRAKSTLRSSRDPSLDSQTPLAHRLVTPTTSTHRLNSGSSDQKYRTLKNTTPSMYTGFKRSGSVSSVGSRVSLTNNKSPLEKKSMQKLLGNKKWVAEQYLKVQRFIQSSGLFNPELSGMIRPPTINIVVELFSVLIGQLIKTDPINSQSYADVVLRTLKLLNYPGTITLSTLKTANTMHGWPHFIYIISWLIERVDIRSMNENFREQQEDNLKKMFYMQDSVFKFFTLQYSMYTDGAAPDQSIVVQGEEILYKEMAEFTGTDVEALKNLEQPIEVLRAEVEELEAELQIATEEIEKIQIENSKRQELIEKCKGGHGSKEQDLEIELTQLRKLRIKQSEYKKKLMVSVRELEKIVTSQSGRYNEKVEILGQIEDLKRAIGRKEKKFEAYKSVREQLDVELETLVKEIESKVDAWNLSITKTLLPEMQNLRLREKGFHSKGFVEELREVLKGKEDITKQLLQEYKEITSEVEKIKKKRESLEKHNKSFNATREKVDSLRNSIQILKEENQKLLLNINKAKEQFDTNEIEKVHLENMKIKESEAELTDLDNRIQKLTAEMDKYAKKGFGVIAKAHDMAQKSMQAIDEFMHSMLKDVTDKAEQSKQNLMDTYNYLLSIQEKSVEMANELNAFHENKENVSNS